MSFFPKIKKSPPDFHPKHPFFLPIFKKPYQVLFLLLLYYTYLKVCLKTQLPVTLHNDQLINIVEEIYLGTNLCYLLVLGVLDDT